LAYSLVFVTHDNVLRKKDVKAVSSKLQVPPLLRQRHNAVLGLLYLSSFGPRSNLSLGPWVTVKPASSTNPY